jgi:Icc-related predicted phosphoesterase
MLPEAPRQPLAFGICSDTHGDAMPDWGHQPLAAVLHGGDVYDADDEFEAISPPRVAPPRIPILAVRGNHDCEDPLGFFTAADDITGGLRLLAGGLWVAGIGFAPTYYYDLPGETDIAPQCQQLLRMARRQVMPGERIILLTHYPPALDVLPPDRWTYACIAKLVDELQPLAVIQGHVHQWAGSGAATAR